uniref:Uncharacterized protein n=1 Tax=Lepeophtheirus salmonis TaxID=72036 RepID=A0A0K2SWU7_LEPSM
MKKSYFVQERKVCCM